MNRGWVLVCALCVVLAGCSSKSTNSNSQTAVFTTTLLPANETPPVTDAEASGSGTVTITMTFNTDSSNNVTSATANITVTVSGFPSTTTITAGHIHQGAPGVAGSIVVSVLGSGDLTLSNGGGTVTKSNINVPTDVAQNMLNGAGGFYFNVHSTAHSGGVIRGQLARAS